MSMITYWGDPPDSRRVGNYILKNGAKFCEFPPQVHVHPEVVPFIAFDYGCKAVATKGVIYILSLIATEVSEIVESFAPEFD